MNDRALRSLLGAAAVLTCLAGLLTGQTVEGVDALQGRWVYSGDDAERERRVLAIDAVADRMSWIIRGIARKRISASTRIHEWYDFRISPSTITIVEAGGNAFSTPRDGTPLEVPKDQGGPASLTRTWEPAGCLRSRWREAKGEGTEIYRLTDGGRTLKVTVIVSSSRLPSDVAYDLTYRRE